MLTTGYAAFSAETPLRPFDIERRNLRPDDVAIEILYSGVCHSDLHQARNGWGATEYPAVPGHEIIGRISATGDAVTRHTIGDLVAVGTMVDSCGTCDQCQKHQEQFCREGAVFTGSGHDRTSGEQIYGGFSHAIVVREEFVLPLPDGLDPSKAAPLMCAGVTSWSPLRQRGIGAGHRVGVIGLGGLGHMAVKLAAALGAEVVVISRDPAKQADAIELGATTFVNSNNPDDLSRLESSLDLIIDTIPTDHPVNPYVGLLDVDGMLALVGYFGLLSDVDSVPLIFSRRSISGSSVGSLAEAQELLAFCAEHQIYPDCEHIRAEQIDEAFDRMERGDVHYRFVIDMASPPA